MMKSRLFIVIVLGCLVFFSAKIIDAEEIENVNETDIQTRLVTANIDSIDHL